MGYNQYMFIDLSPIQYTFHTKPLLIGGKAKEYYGIRKAGADIDLVVTRHDYDMLAKRYPNNTVDLFGDLGVKVYGFEIWTCICLFDYEFLSPGAVEKEQYFIISLEKLLFLTALAIKKEKYHKDLELTVEKILELQYKK